MRRCLAITTLALAASIQSNTASAANDAFILASESSVPASVFPGAAVTVRVRVRNTGTTIWSRDTFYRLGAADNELPWLGYSCGGYMNAVTDGRVFLCQNVPPGGAHDFVFQILAPASGTRKLAVRMVRDGVEWFGTTYRWTVTAAETARNDAAIDSPSSSIPASLAPGGTGATRIRVRNTGTTTWRAGEAYRLGAQATNQLTWTGFPCGGYMNRLSDARVYLCRDVPPGDSYDFDFLAGAPPTASGSLELSLRMVRDGVEWFGESRSFVVPIDVGPRLPDVVVKAVSVSPPSPSPGEATSFSALVENRGSAATPPGVAVGVAYFVDGQYRTWGSVVTSLAPGASLTVTTQGGPWIATAGSHSLTALVDDVDRFAEEDENNNSLSTSFEVPVVSPPPSGADLFGMNIDPANPAGHPSGSLLRDLGTRFLRIEWKASPGFSFYDEAIASYRASGLKILLLVDYASVPGSPGSTAPDSEWNEYIARFVASVSEIATHYGNAVDAWQIWNEPDLSFPGSGYDPGVPAALYGVMLRDATAAIRARSTRPVVTGGLASGDPGYLSTVRSATGSLTVDAVAVHPYGQRAPDDWPNSGWGFGNMSDLFNRYLAFGLPLWVTEIGTVDEANQAAYLGNVYDLVESRFAGRVTHVFWFCWSDGMVAPFGVVTASGSPKPSYWQYRAVAPPPD